MSDEGDSDAERRTRDAAIYATIRDLGATRAVVAFSGGHDEGGPDDVRLFDDERELPTDHDWELYERLGEPIYDEYGGFAGQYHVSGELRIDAVEETMALATLEGADEYREFCEAEERGYMDSRAADRGQQPKRSLLARLFGRR